MANYESSLYYTNSFTVLPYCSPKSSGLLWHGHLLQAICPSSGGRTFPINTRSPTWSSPPPNVHVMTGKIGWRCTSSAMLDCNRRRFHKAWKDKNGYYIWQRTGNFGAHFAPTQEVWQIIEKWVSQSFSPLQAGKPLLGSLWSSKKAIFAIFDHVSPYIS